MTHSSLRSACSVYSLLILLLYGTLVPHMAHATSGLMTITKTTKLKENHRGQIRFGANNITLDCAGHKISYSAPSSGGCGTNGASTCGIHVRNRTGITITSCKVVGGYDYGMWINGTTTSSKVEHSSVTKAGVGFRVESASHLRISNSAAVSNQAGVEVRNSTDVTFMHTHAVYSTGDGFDINDSTKTQIHYAFVYANGVNGIEFDDSPNSRVLNTEAQANGKHGISFDNSTGIYISRNLIHGNVENGVRLQNCDFGTIRYNQVDNNGSCNANQDVASTGNSWTGNTLQNWCGTVPTPH